MAGAGYKLFNTGDVLTAAQVNTYLQEQTVMVFASSAARTSALSGVLAEGMVSYLQDTNAVEVYNGSAWVGVSGAGDLTEIVAGTGITITSGTGPIPTVALTTPVAATNGGTAQTTYTTGDLLYASGTNTLAKRAIGTTGQVLTVSGGVPTWATPAGGGGKLLQVVTAVSTGYIAITGNNVYADANLSATITPSATTSRILVLVTQGFGSYQNTASASNDAYAKIMRGATTIWQSDATSSAGVTYTSKAYAETSWTTITLHYVDSPSSTSALTYKTQWKQSDNANDHTLYMNYGTYPSQITLFEIGA